MKYPYSLSNEADCVRAISELENQRLKELGRDQSPVRALHNTQISCVGFIYSNPNAQIDYAVQNGIFPETGNLPDGK